MENDIFVNNLKIYFHTIVCHVKIHLYAKYVHIIGKCDMYKVITIVNYYLCSTM